MYRLHKWPIYQYFVERDFESPEEDDTKDNGKGKAPESKREGEKPREIAQCTLSTEVQVIVFMVRQVLLRR